MQSCLLVLPGLVRLLLSSKLDRPQRLLRCGFMCMLAAVMPAVAALTNSIFAMEASMLPAAQKGRTLSGALSHKTLQQARRTSTSIRHQGHCAV